MAVKIRLQRKGRKKAPFYHIVIADSRSPRDGKYIERIGSYNPMTSPATIDIDRDAAFNWLTKGAQPTDTVRAILRFKGVLYKKHLQRGVAKGAMDQNEADKKLNDWIESKEAVIEKRKAAKSDETKAKRVAISGTAKAAPAKETPVEEVVVAETAPVIEEVIVTEAETPVEVAPIVEEVVAVSEDAPAAEAIVDEVVVEEAPAVEAAIEEAPAAEIVEEIASSEEESAQTDNTSEENITEA